MPDVDATAPHWCNPMGYLDIDNTLIYLLIKQLSFLNEIPTAPTKSYCAQYLTR